jgi:chemosensory pili system protein ChpA (sensor histidine kinase/response regulator)
MTPGSPANEIVIGYVEEVRTYLPVLARDLGRLAPGVPPDSASAEELHRLVHTIAGASRMVGIPGLSRIADQMEAVLAEIQAGALVPDAGLLEAMGATVERFRAYCDGLMGPGLAPGAMLRETVLQYRRCRNLPESGDEAALAPLLEGIPETEPGAGLDPDAPPPESHFEPEFEFESDPEPGPPPTNLPPPSPRRIPAPGFQSDSAPPATIPDLPPELVEGFYEEAREHLEDLDGFLNQLETEISAVGPITRERREIVRQVRRSIHTLKGAAAVIGFTAISAWGHAVEDFLDWLHDEAREIGPETVGLLVESGDLMARLVADPTAPRAERAEAIRARYAEIMGASPAKSGSPAPGPAASGSVAPDSVASCPAPEEPAPAPSAVAVVRDADEEAADAPGRRRTLRVATDRIDAMVNLAGELMIVAGAFEGGMKELSTVARELELARNRLRDIARNLETGFEVKALTRLRNAEAPGEFDDFDSLELDRYSELNLIIRSLAETAGDVGAIHGRLANLHGEFDGHLNRQRVVLREIQERMMQTRMLPLSTLGNRLRRTVREVAKHLGKRVRLIVEGEGIELDRLVWDRITDPLMHLLRNAVDHGVESPEARRAAGKPPAAAIRLSARREGSRVAIRISDDGAGLDYRAIRRKALGAGLISEDADPSEETLAGLIFRPGFSTRDAITEVSGRGVGMDVVRENIRELKGTIRVVSWPGRGTRFTIRIPLTLAAVRSLLFALGDRIYAVPLDEVRDISRAEPGWIVEKPRRAIRMGDRMMPLHALRDLLPASPAPPSETPLVLRVALGDREHALEIDGLVGQREIVVKDMGSHLRSVRGVSGVTILGDGGVVPILNLPELLGEGAGGGVARAEVRGESRNADPPPIQDRPLSILVVDDSVSIRQVVSRLMENQGWRVRTAKDGLDALEQVRKDRPDLIVLDIEMPRMNGYEFLSAMGGEPAMADVPVVMLTSRAATKHRDRAVALGASGFVIKPYNDHEFVDLVLNLAG